MEYIRSASKDFDDEKRKIFVKGVLLPPHTSYSEAPSDLDNEGIRPFATGILRRNRIRKNVFTIPLSWQYITPSTAEDILSLVSDESFQVSLYDRTQKKRVVKTMYRSAEYNYEEVKFKGGYIATLSFTLIEC